MHFFSPSTLGFYKSSLNDLMPPDAIALTPEEYRALVTDRPADRYVVVDEAGAPVLRTTATNSLEQIYESQLMLINRECEKAITAGFTSAALVTLHTYSSELEDQLNLTGAILRGADMPYACRDEQGVKEFRMHTAEQLRQVGDDFTVYKLQHLQRANMLKQQLDQALAAGDLAALEAVTWESEH